MKVTDRALSTLISTIRPELWGNLVYQNDNHSYVLFNKYILIKTQNGCCVTRHSDENKFLFSSLKIATAWCTLDRYNKIIESRRVQELDNSISSAIAEKINLNRLRGRANPEQKEIYRDKLLQIVSHQKQFQWELDKYIILAKKCQQRGFDHELTRATSQ